jgi:phytanoyl-CoA hydroxylase
MTEAVLSFAGQGYALLPAAVDCAAIDRYRDALRDVAPEQLILIEHETGVRSYHPSKDNARLRIPLNRLTETHWGIPAGMAMLRSSKRVVSTLQQILDSSQILCFETFHHEVGLGMRFHREGWYVTLREGGPSAMVTLWIALDDISEGGGELQYAPGSHQFPGFEDARLQAANEHEGVVARFGEECRRAGVQRFCASKGDVLVTRGDLGVAGDPVAADCPMLVAHFCALPNDPGYFAKLAPEFRVKRQVTAELYSSTVYVGKY